MAAESPPKLQIPRWIQLVTLPLLLLLIWAVAGAVRHVIFLFLVAGLIAFLLNPLVRGITRIWIPRGLGVAIVYLLFASLVAAASIALGRWWSIRRGRPHIGSIPTLRPSTDNPRRPMPSGMSTAFKCG